MTHTNKTETRFLVGVEDEASGEVTLHEAGHAYALRQSVAGREDDVESNAMDGTDWKEQRDALVNQFGSKKKKAVIRYILRAMPSSFNHYPTVIVVVCGVPIVRNVTSNASVFFYPVFLLAKQKKSYSPSKIDEFKTDYRCSPVDTASDFHSIFLVGEVGEKKSFFPEKGTK